MTLQAFISYKSEYRDFAERLRESIHAWGHRVWLDVFDIPAGTQPGSKGWDDAIHHGMRSSQIVIGVLTPESLKSENVLDEWGWALENNRRLFLLWLRDVDSEDIPPRYVRIQRIDLRKDTRQGFNRLQQALASPGLIAPHENPVGTRNGASAATPIATTPKDDNRARMIQNVRDSWIKGVLEPALQGTEFDLGMTLKPDAVLKHADFGDYALPTTAGILQVFDDLGKELLILGAPGAGKTILLLQLARELLNRAENDPRQPIPVVFNLSSWAAERKPLSDWLTERLKLEYGVSKKLAIRWQENENLLLLLDGLDEVNETYRNDCVQVINTYRQQHHNLISMVVCSRIADYDLLTNRLNLTGALLLRELTEEQINSQISVSDYVALRSAMTTEPYLHEMAKTPFLLNAMTYTYRGSTSGDFNHLNDEISRRDHLFARFVKSRLQTKSSEGLTRMEVERYLAWLARMMFENQRIIFYIEDQQPIWLPTQKLQRRYRWLNGVSYGLPGGILMGSWVTMQIYLPDRLSDVLLYGLMSGLISATMMGLAGLLDTQSSGFMGKVAAKLSDPIKPIETLRWHFTENIIRTRQNSILLLILLLVFGLVSGLNVVHQLGPKGGLIFGLIGLLVLSMPSISESITSENILVRSFPNQSIWMSLRIGLISALVIGLITGLAVSLVFEVPVGLAIGLIFGLTFGFLFSWKAAIQHLILRIILTRAGYAPWNYAAFLDYCASVGILRKVGGGYIFAHRMLLEYFAGLAGENSSTIEAGS